ncbi:Basic-leucine zipper domain [Dillenia turbinata]|uniref:Basic-leucine zipper domain n=1 Tax=Dillenia turbinata TaxID=194707 RepID=A0AAN8ZIN5_9MAGN
MIIPPDVLNFLDDPDSTPTPNPPQPQDSSSIPSPFGPIEHFLMTDDPDLQNQDQEFYHNFLSDVLLDSPPPCSYVSDHKDSLNNNTSSPDEATADRNVDDDPVSKKRMRQLRNRDAAVRSRERKKMYVKDLEMKSKYLVPAIGTLHQSGKAPGAPMSKQESAVLLLESLLLGSLLWFLGIMCLFSFPPVLHPKLDALVLPDEDDKGWGNLPPRRVKTRCYGIWESRSFVKSKRCKASRTRMKSIFSCSTWILV